jgi:hypothetical protein
MARSAVNGTVRTVVWEGGGGTRRPALPDEYPSRGKKRPRDTESPGRGPAQAIAWKSGVCLPTALPKPQSENGRMTERIPALATGL